MINALNKVEDAVEQNYIPAARASYRPVLLTVWGFCTGLIAGNVLSVAAGSLIQSYLQSLEYFREAGTAW